MRKFNWQTEEALSILTEAHREISKGVGKAKDILEIVGARHGIPGRVLASTYYDWVKVGCPNYVPWTRPKPGVKRVERKSIQVYGVSPKVVPLGDGRLLVIFGPDEIYVAKKAKLE